MNVNTINSYTNLSKKSISPKTVGFQGKISDSLASAARDAFRDGFTRHAMDDAGDMNLIKKVVYPLGFIVDAAHTICLFGKNLIS